jgi:hypothetical protein
MRLVTERKCVLAKAERVDQNEIVELLGHCKIGCRYVDVIDSSDFNHALLLCVVQRANVRPLIGRAHTRRAPVQSSIVRITYREYVDLLDATGVDRYRTVGISGS